MKRLACFAIGLMSLAATAQQIPAPAMAPGPGPDAAASEPRTYISAAEIKERIVKADAATKSGTKYNGGPLLLQGAFRANLEYHDTPAANVSVHENDSELFVVVEGSGTMTLGGTLVNPTRNGTNLQATSAQGGTPYKLVKGDMILIPENTAHSITQVDGKIVLMSLHLPRPAAAPPLAH